MNLPVFYFLSFISGVVSLIYQVIWNRYLGILLGVQARATVVVVSFFLGGMALGYIFWGKWLTKQKVSPLRFYGRLELGIALWGALFPFIYRQLFGALGWLFSYLGLNSIWVDFLVSGILLLPPTFLMGGVLPALSQAFQSHAEKTSWIHSRFYGLNTLGGALGCLLASYFILPHFSFVQISSLCSFTNFAIGLIGIFLQSKNHSAPEPQILSQTILTPWRALTISFLSGYSAISIEICLMRIMGLSAGSSGHHFALLLALIILGLGFGAITLSEDERWSQKDLFKSLLFSSFFLIVLYLSVNYWSYAFHLARISVNSHPLGYYLYQTLLFILAGLVVLPPFFFSGRVLPLLFSFTHPSQTAAERVGKIYATNAIGCLMGSLVGGYLLFHWFNLEGVFRVAIFASLLAFTIANHREWLAAALLVTPFFLPSFMHSTWVQPFRLQQVLPISFDGPAAWHESIGKSVEFIVWRDDPNTSVGISKNRAIDSSRTLFVNGKSDGNTKGDRFTTELLGHIPGVLHPKLETAAVIGLGTGTTGGVLSLYPTLNQLDVIEISPTVTQNLHLFDLYNYQLSKSPKLAIHTMDAIRYFTGTAKKYDLIVSEPSNPWVEGVENLYAANFYQIAKERLNPGGFFVQWIHSYSFNSELFEMVLKSMATQFKYLSVFELSTADIAIMAYNQPIQTPQLIQASKKFENPTLSRSLQALGVQNLSVLLALERVPGQVGPIMGEKAELHTWEFPKLQYEASLAFFLNQMLDLRALRRDYRSYFGNVEQSLLSQYRKANPDPTEPKHLSKAYCQHSVSNFPSLCEEAVALIEWKGSDPLYVEPRRTMLSVREKEILRNWSKPVPSKFTPSLLEETSDRFAIFKKFYSPILEIPVDPIIKRLDSCLSQTSKKETLHGHCLLEKIMVYETVQKPNPLVQSIMTEYLEWFPSADPKQKDFRRFYDAKQIVERVLAAAKDATPASP